MNGRRRRPRGGHDQPVPGTAADQTPDADPAVIARSVALRQLTAAPRTRAQLAEAMARRNVPDEVAEEVLERFEAVGLVDDAEYARMWVESRHSGRGLARRALEHELRTRGVDPVLAREAAGQLDDDAELAAVSGLDTEMVVRWTWIIGAALAAIAGVFAGLDTSAHPNLGWNLLMPMFAAAVVGGLGSPLGAVIGSFIVAFSELIVTNAWKKIFGYLVPPEWLGDGLYQALSTDYKVAVSFTILIMVLLFRPQGIFGGK